MSFKKKIFKFSFSQKILAFIGYLYILFVGYTSKIQIKKNFISCYGKGFLIQEVQQL